MFFSSLFHTHTHTHRLSLFSSVIVPVNQHTHSNFQPSPPFVFIASAYSPNLQKKKRKFLFHFFRVPDWFFDFPRCVVVVVINYSWHLGPAVTNWSGAGTIWIFEKKKKTLSTNKKEKKKENLISAQVQVEKKLRDDGPMKNDPLKKKRKNIWRKNLFLICCWKKRKEKKNQ